MVFIGTKSLNNHQPANRGRDAAQHPTHTNTKHKRNRSSVLSNGNSLRSAPALTNCRLSLSPGYCTDAVMATACFPRVKTPSNHRGCHHTPLNTKSNNVYSNGGSLQHQPSSTFFSRQATDAECAEIGVLKNDLLSYDKRRRDLGVSDRRLRRPQVHAYVCTRMTFNIITGPLFAHSSRDVCMNV